MKALIVLALLGLAFPAAADDAGQGPAPAPAASDEGQVPAAARAAPECYCTDSRGNRVEVGELACLQIGSRQVTSRCEKARNLVIWRHQSEGCAPGV